MKFHPISTAAIRYVNSLGPFDHGVWESLDGSVRFGASGSQPERARYLLNFVKEILNSRFPHRESFSLLDIGCYDGWMLYHLEQYFPGASFFGYEPRLKNIEKGRMIREFLGLKLSAEIRTGGGDWMCAFVDFKPDVILSLGVLHHLANHDAFIRSLSDKTDFLIFSSLVMPESAVKSPEYQDFLGEKDVLGREGKPRFVAFKAESAYFDGSINATGLVGLPTSAMITSILAFLGFTVQREVQLPDCDYRIRRGVHSAPEVVWTASRTREGPPDAIDEENMILESEFPHLSLALPTALFCSIDVFYLTVVKALGPRAAQTLTDRFIKVVSVWPFFQKFLPLLRALRYNFRDKLDFERAKILFFGSRSSVSEAELLFRELLDRPDCDWRVFYRSCFFLHAMDLRKAEAAETNVHLEILHRANPGFPVERLLSRLRWMGA